MNATVRTVIRFRNGIDQVPDVPEVARINGLLNRTAIIQETYRPGKVDMFFDEDLWRRLLEFAQSFENGGSTEIIDVGLASKGAMAKLLGQASQIELSSSVEEFLERWASIGSEEREPPLRIVVRKRNSAILCVNTEFWTRIGGPPEYHDSYTYSVFSRVDQMGSIRQFLTSATGADKWSFIE